MQLHYKKTGNSGSNILILHGLFGHRGNWQSIATHLSQHHQVYALDLRNHGLSPHSNQMSYQHMIEDVSHFITQHKLDDVNIIGHSMGGKVAMYLALNKPQLIKSLVIADIAPVNYQHNFSNIMNALLQVPLTRIKSRKEADNYLSSKISNKNFRQFLLHSLHLEKPSLKGNGNYWKFNLQILNESVNDLVAFPAIPPKRKYSGKCLFISGQNSDYINERNKKNIKSFFPNSKIVTVKGAGHLLHAEKTELVKSILSAFLTLNDKMRF